jgi:hypothetical protein
MFCSLHLCGFVNQIYKIAAQFSCNARFELLRFANLLSGAKRLILMIINFEQVHNYYERIVFEGVARLSSSYPDYDPGMLADVACVALNRLPARYVRHDVDMMFYLTEQERHVIEESLREALTFAFGFVGERTSQRIESI